MLDQRSSSLLEILLQSSSVTNKTLQNSLSISRRQVDYAINKLNDWLSANGIDAVQKESGKIFLTEKAKMDISLQVNEIENEYVLSEQDRIALMYLHIASNADYMSVEHLVQLTKVSRNTVLRDMKVLMQTIEPYQLKIDYSRTYGYRVEGKEWDIRNGMMHFIKTTVQQYALQAYLMESLSITELEMDEMINKLSAVESVLEREFVDIYFNQLPYQLFAIFNRIKGTHAVTNPFFIEAKAIADTKEYEASDILLSELEVPETERMYISLQLLSTPIHSKSQLTISLPELRNVVATCVNNFEKIAVVNLPNKQELVEKLYTHLKPAYYRITFNLTTDYSYLDTINRDYANLYKVVEESFKPLADFFGDAIPKKELMLITLFFGGTLIEKTEAHQVELKTAIVVCPNGITISNLLENTLKKLLPEIYFEGTKSVRRFEADDTQYDFVFSQVPLKTNQHVIYMNDLSSNEEQINLRRKVISEMYGLPHININAAELIEAMKEHIDIKNYQKLEATIQRFLSDDKVIQKDNTSIALSDILPAHRCQIVQSVEDFHEAIELASQPLLQDGIITNQYVDTMKQLYPIALPHILLRQQIAIPHADIESGANDLGFSFLKLNEPLKQGDVDIHFICVIAAKDKQSHLNAILKLIEIAEDEDVIEQMRNMTEANALYNIMMR